MGIKIGPRSLSPSIHARIEEAAALGVRAYFYPHEVAEILAVSELDYRQLRRLREAVATVPSVARGWARFSLADVAAVQIGLNLSGGIGRLARGSRLSVAPVEAACSALRAIGYACPVLQVDMIRVGSRILAQIDGNFVDPLNGQTVMSGLSGALTETLQTTRTFLASRGFGDDVWASFAEDLREIEETKFNS